jgi:hypothetical protein
VPKIGKILIEAIKAHTPQIGCQHNDFYGNKTYPLSKIRRKDNQQTREPLNALTSLDLENKLGNP